MQLNDVLRQKKAKYTLPYSNKVQQSQMILYAFPSQISPLKRKEFGECLGDQIFLLELQML